MIIKNVVKLEKNKIVIEIETGCPAGDLQDLQKEIIRIIQHFNYADFGCNNDCPFLNIGYLLEATLPEDSFYTNLLKNKN